MVIPGYTDADGLPYDDELAYTHVRMGGRYAFYLRDDGDVGWTCADWGTMPDWLQVCWDYCLRPLSSVDYGYFRQVK